MHSIETDLPWMKLTEKWSLFSEWSSICPTKASSDICDSVVGMILKLNSKRSSSGNERGYATYDDSPLMLPKNDGCRISRSCSHR